MCFQGIYDFLYFYCNNDTFNGPTTLFVVIIKVIFCNKNNCYNSFKDLVNDMISS